MGKKRVEVKQMAETGLVQMNFTSVMSAAMELASSEANCEVMFGPKRKVFPEQLKTRVAVSNPKAVWRLYYDMVVSMCAAYSCVETPFEFAFVGSVVRESCPRLWWANMVIEVVFFFDVLLSFNTAIFDAKRDRWILSHCKIARRYCRSYLLPDVLGIIPWGAVGRYGKLYFLHAHGVSSLRRRRLFDACILIKLIRVTKLRRIRLIWNSEIRRVPHTRRIVFMYVLLVLTMQHYVACMLRYLDEVVRGLGTKTLQDKKTFLHPRDNAARTYFALGLWAQYVVCFEWAIGCTLGSIGTYENLAEACLSIVANLVGMLYMSFIIADLSTALASYDPALNEYNMVTDTLQSFLISNHVPKADVQKVREYLDASESLFRMNFNFNLISLLSPQLQRSVTLWLLGNACMRLPFIIYAKQSALDLRSGRTIWVTRPVVNKDAAAENASSQASSSRGPPRSQAQTSRAGADGDQERLVPDGGLGTELLEASVRDAVPPSEQDGAFQCKITHVDRLGRFTVKYNDNGSTEAKVVQSRLVLERMDPILLHRSKILELESQCLVAKLAHVLQTNMFMRDDVVVNPMISYNETLYLIEEGSVKLVGRDIAQPFVSEFVYDKQAFGEDIAMLATRTYAKRLRWYSARSREVTRLYCLDAKDLFETLELPSFATFKKYIRVYGTWISLKVQMVENARGGVLREIVAKQNASNLRLRGEAEASDESSPLDGSTVEDSTASHSAFDERFDRICDQLIELKNDVLSNRRSRPCRRAKQTSRAAPAASPTASSTTTTESPARTRGADARRQLGVVSRVNSHPRYSRTPLSGSSMRAPRQAGAAGARPLQTPVRLDDISSLRKRRADNQRRAHANDVDDATPSWLQGQKPLSPLSRAPPHDLDSPKLDSPQRRPAATAAANDDDEPPLLKVLSRSLGDARNAGSSYSDDGSDAPAAADSNSDDGSDAPAAADSNYSGAFVFYDQDSDDDGA